MKKTEKNILELEESLSKIKKYYDYDDIEYKGIRGVGNLFIQSTDEDYYKPIKTFSVFDNKNNYIEYEIKVYKDKNLSVQEYLDMIRPYLSYMLNDHKIQEDRKIKLTMSINFMSSTYSEENLTMHSKIQCRIYDR